MGINTVDLIGDEALTASIIDRSITEISDDVVAKVGAHVFYKCGLLTTVNFPAAKSVEASAFCVCPALADVNFPAATSVGDSAFSSCSVLTDVNFPAATSVERSAFSYSKALATADFSALRYIGVAAFSSCSALTALILRNTENICELSSTSSLGSTPIASGTGYIYVPRALLSDTDSTKDYRRATNWSTYSAQFRALEDHTVDGTVTGDLDPTKI